jgi:dolichyl-phosphate-mannose--protein O-mannosyl transferase
MVVGFLAYFLIWVPIDRILFLYHYMPSVYIGYLALAAILADFWSGGGEQWESLAIMFVMLFALIIGVGHIVSVYKPAFIPARMRTMAGLPFVIALTLPYVVLLKRPLARNRYVVAAFLTLSALLFIYYLPVWIGTPIQREGYYARMWLQGPGLRNWI